MTPRIGSLLINNNNEKNKNILKGRFTSNFITVKKRLAYMNRPGGGAGCVCQDHVGGNPTETADPSSWELTHSGPAAGEPAWD